MDCLQAILEYGPRVLWWASALLTPTFLALIPFCNAQKAGRS